MPKEIQSRREVLRAIEKAPPLEDLLEMHDGHYEYELDLEVCVYGRNYHGKQVGPYIKLLAWEPGETIIPTTFRLSTGGATEKRDRAEADAVIRRFIFYGSDASRSLRRF